MTRKASVSIAVALSLAVGVAAGWWTQRTPEGERGRGAARRGERVDSSSSKTSGRRKIAGVAARNVPADGNRDRPTLDFSGRSGGARARRNEPRDEAWAVSMEAAMTPLLSARLAEDYPLAQLVSVRCRSTSCTIEYDLPAARAKEIWVYLQLTMPQGTRVAPSLGIDDDGDGVTRATFDGVFDDDMGGGADFREWFAWASEITDQQRDEIRDWQRRGIEWWE